MVSNEIYKVLTVAIVERNTTDTAHPKALWSTLRHTTLEVEPCVRLPRLCDVANTVVVSVNHGP